MATKPKAQFAVHRVDTVQNSKFLIWNGTKRFFPTMLDALKAVRNDKIETTETKPVKLASGIYATIEETFKTKYKWTISKRYVTEWEIVDELEF